MLCICKSKKEKKKEEGKENQLSISSFLQLQRIEKEKKKALLHNRTSKLLQQKSTFDSNEVLAETSCLCCISQTGLMPFRDMCFYNVCITWSSITVHVAYK